MSWKNVKDYYRIVHQVQVTEAGICIGSPYIHDIIVISREGAILKDDDRTWNDELQRYQQEMRDDLGKLRELVTTEDIFGRSIPVYTYSGAEIIEKQCEELGWPNVTHDGLMMYENTFSPDRKKVIEWAKSNCLARIENTRLTISSVEERLSELNARLTAAENDAVTLGLKPPAPKDNPLLAATHNGMKVDYRGLLKQAQRGLRRDPGIAEMLRQMEEHLTELGQRWYAGDAAVVDELLQLYCIERDARKALVAAEGSDR